MKYFLIFFALAGGTFVHSGYLYNNGLGTECLYDEDCITRNSFCKGNKICACKIGYQYDPGSDVCFPKEVELKCNEDYDCSALQNAKCISGRCKCKSDYVPARNKDACLPSMRLTSMCEEDIQCNSVMNNSYCDQGRRQCVCERGLRHDPYRMLCVEKKKLHNPCFSARDCETSQELIGIVDCVQKEGAILLKECVCAEGYTERDDMCYKDGSSHAMLSLPTFFGLLLVKWFI